MMRYDKNAVPPRFGFQVVFRKLIPQRIVKLSQRPSLAVFF
jgi:hypothetical protein